MESGSIVGLLLGLALLVASPLMWIMRTRYERYLERSRQRVGGRGPTPVFHLMSYVTPFVLAILGVALTLQSLA